MKNLDPASYCRRVTRQSGSSFYYPLLFLPKQKREALYAIYAFCRHSDDLVDEIAEPNEARKQLAAWREELQRTYEGAPRHPITERLYEIMARYPIPKIYFEELLLGMAMDLENQRYRTFEELSSYCYRVASVVGLACIEVFQYSHPQAKEYAIAQGMALQLTNILRDLPEDLGRGRIYLPLEEMDRFGYSEADLHARRYNDSFVELMRFQWNRARDYYQQAESLLWPPDRGNLIVAEIMRSIYWRIFQKIEATGFNVFEIRSRISSLQKFGIALSTWRECRSASLPLGRHDRPS